MNAPYRAAARDTLRLVSLPGDSSRAYRPPAPPQPAACYPDFLALDVVERLVPGTPSRFSHALKARSGDGLHRTGASFEARFDGEHPDTAIIFRGAGSDSSP